VTFGARVLALPNSSDPYTQKYKGIWLCLAILTRALSGNYVNFGVFDLYGDRALKVRPQAPAIASALGCCNDCVSWRGAPTGGLPYPAAARPVDLWCSFNGRMHVDG
jgi:hypothetical protein